jgi:hypothetical protein
MPEPGRVGPRPTAVRSRLSLLAVLTTLVLAGVACDDGGSDDVAQDPARNSASSPADQPPAPAVPDGPVRTRDLATVMDQGQGSVELCLGPVAESYPPQCGGPDLVAWDWAAHAGTYDEQGDIRWGTYALTGTWDGTAFTATDAVPGALYDPAMPTPAPTPPPLRAHSDTDLQRIAATLTNTPGVLGAFGGQGSQGHVLADVYYDDGSLQQWADTTYGANVVVVSSLLVDAG